LLFPFNPNWHDDYPVANFNLHVARSANDRGVSADRFIIVPPLEDRSHVLELLKAADIYVDSFPYSGMTSSLLDPLEAGLPIVAIEGGCQRQRMSASALRLLDLAD
jgi:predicted O-linked N-acetylglucosamine transferase (SPINDLY family)